MGDAEYITLSAVLATMTISVNWSFINSFLPSTKFQALEPEIDKILKLLDKHKDTGETGETLKITKDCILLMARLDKLGIAVPDDPKLLWHVIPILGAMAKVKDLKSARKLEPMKKELISLTDMRE